VTVTVLALVLTGCSGSSDDTSNAGDTTAGRVVPRSPDAATTRTTGGATESSSGLLAYGACLREHGIEVPDVLVNPGGGAGSGDTARGDGLDPDLLRRARQACGEPPDSLTRLVDPEQREQVESKLVDFARCMRRNGVDMPDPDLSRGLTAEGLGPFQEFVDGNDPAVRKALRACQQILLDLMTTPGGLG
jgi:hypothetical protein